MPRHQRAVGRHPTQGQRNTGVCGHRKFGGDAWNHLKGNASLVKNTALLPSRPNTKGSPPFKRTTTRPARTCSTIRRFISSCGTVWEAVRLPCLLYTSDAADDLTRVD